MFRFLAGIFVTIYAINAFKQGKQAITREAKERDRQVNSSWDNFWR